MTFTLRDLLKSAAVNRFDSEQIEEGRKKAHTDEQNIVRPTADEQRIRRQQQTAKARAAKQTRPPEPEPVKTVPAQQADTMKLPERDDLRRLYLTVVLLAQQQIDAGWGPVVPHWKVMSELRDETFDESPRYMLQDLERDGFVRQIVTRKRGTLSWIPTILDDSQGRGARSSKGGHSSDIRRAVDALEREYLSAATKR